MGVVLPGVSLFLFGRGSSTLSRTWIMGLFGHGLRVVRQSLWFHAGWVQRGLFAICVHGFLSIIPFLFMNLHFYFLF